MLNRIQQEIFDLFGVSIMIFVLSRVVPGNPGRLALGPRTTQEAVDELNHQLYMDKPLPVQYACWIRDIFKGDLGISIVTKRSVSQDVAQFLPATLELVLVAGVFMVCGALLLGTLAARFKDSFVAGLVRVMSYTGNALPSFVVSILFMLLLGHVWLVIPVFGLLPGRVTPLADITGLYILDGLLTGRPAVAWDTFLHLILPAQTLLNVLVIRPPMWNGPRVRQQRRANLTHTSWASRTSCLTLAYMSTANKSGSDRR